LEKAGLNDIVLGEAYEALGELYKEDGRIPDAIKARRNAVRAGEKLAAETKDLDSRWRLGIAYDLLGGLLARENMAQEAEAAFRKSCALWEKLAAETNASDHRWHLATAYELLGGLFKQANKAKEAEAAYRKSAAVWEELARAQPDSLDICWHVYSSYQARIDLLPPQERNAAAAQLVLKTEAAFREAVRLRPEYGDAYRSLGIFLKNTGKPDEAVACYRQAIRLNPKDASASINLSTALAEKGWDLANRPDPKLRDIKGAVAASKEAVELGPQSALAWQYLGWVQYRAGNWKASIDALEESCKLQKGGDRSQWFVMSLAHGKLANEEGLAEQERDRRQTEARRWYDQGVKQIDSGEGGAVSEAVRTFGAEAWELLNVKEKRK
jgi:tetratricopeptide (TPR) repeat protein